MTIKKPMVSIIMGIYNCEKTLEKSIESIINQTYTNWELIMCDDCSNDDTFKIAKKYENTYKNIKLIKNEINRGLAFSLNRCLEKAKGKYIARMDADDISLLERLEIQVEFLETNIQYQVVGSSIILFDENGDKGVRQVKEIPEKYDITRNVPHVHPSIMMRKETYDKLNGYTVSSRTRRGQDLDLWFRFYANGFKGYNIQKPLLKYHEGVDDYKKRNIRTAFEIMKTIYIGYKIIDIPKSKYIYILKPIISVFIPNKLMYLYHKNRKIRKKQRV